jgi:hypothetical protein
MARERDDMLPTIEPSCEIQCDTDEEARGWDLREGEENGDEETITT